MSSYRVSKRKTAVKRLPVHEKSNILSQKTRSTLFLRSSSEKSEENYEGVN